jgi:hypothetical protein
MQLVTVIRVKEGLVVMVMAKAKEMGDGGKRHAEKNKC